VTVRSLNLFLLLPRTSVLGYYLSPARGWCFCGAFCFDIREMEPTFRTEHDKGGAPDAKTAIIETAGPSTALASLRFGRDDNIYSTKFRDATRALG
jgi:hypothetical protein